MRLLGPKVTVFFTVLLVEHKKGPNPKKNESNNDYIKVVVSTLMVPKDMKQIIFHMFFFSQVGVMHYMFAFETIT